MLKLLAFASALLAAAPASAASYAVLDRMPGPDGGYDYLAVDSAAGRLFVAREYGVMAVDLASRRVQARLAAADDVSAVILIPGSDRMLVTAYGADKALVLERSSGALVGEVATGKAPDAAAYDPFTGLVLVMNAGGAGVTLVDPAKPAAVGAIPLPGQPEAVVSDGRGRAYVNLEDRAEIAVLDLKARKVAGRYKLAGCVEPTGLALDAVSGVLISVCHNRLVRLVDARTGADRGAVAVGENADGVIFDARRRVVFIPCKDGTLSVFPLDRKGRPGRAEVVRTTPGARTAALDPATGRLYLAAARPRTGADGEEELVPGAFEILTVGPK